MKLTLLIVFPIVAGRAAKCMAPRISDIVTKLNMGIGSHGPEDDIIAVIGSPGLRRAKIGPPSLDRTPLLLPKENLGYGCISTGAPILFAVNPELLKASLTPPEGRVQ